MSQKKPILILCNSYRSGEEYYERHLSQLNAGVTPADPDWVWTYKIAEPKTLRLILETHPRIDFDGCILPEFWENPEQAKILLAIQRHKFNIDKQLAVNFLKAIAPSTKT